MNTRTAIAAVAALFVALRSFTAPIPFHQSVELAVDDAHTNLVGRFLSPHGLLLDCVGDIPTPQDCAECRPNAMGCGCPIENGPMLTGPWLVAMCERARRTGCEADRALCRRLASGLLLAASVTNVPGMVVRGVGTDGTCHFPLGSEDQTLSWFMGLFAYWRSGIPTASERAEVTARIVAVGQALEAHGWKCPCDGPFAGESRGDFRGGLPFRSSVSYLYLLKAMAEVSGDPSWEARYRAAGEEPHAIGRLSRFDLCARGYAADFGLFEVETSGMWLYAHVHVALRMLRDMERDSTLRAKFGRALQVDAARAAQFFGEADAYDNAAGGRFGRGRLERDGMAEPLACCVVAAASGSNEYRDAIASVIRHYDFRTLDSGAFSFAELAWYELPEKAGLPLSDDVARARAEAILGKMTLDQKVSLLGGCATMYLNAIPAVGIAREWAMSDCSHAIKPEHGRADWPYVEGVDNRCTVMPPLSALAMTWNAALAKLHGHVMGEQMRARGKDQLLGPGVNINRNPLCGRNWEYMGEDPCQVSKLVVPVIRAIQSHGMAATVKHFCLNNQELNRMAVDTLVDERTLHEIYLPAFKAAIQEGESLSLMTAYNRYNGHYCSENAYLQRGILRDRFGFKGMIVTDWGGQHSTVPAALNGGNVEMDRGRGIVHFTDHFNGRLPLADAVRKGDVPEATVDEMALRVVWTMAKTGFLDGLQDRGEILTERHRSACREIGEEAVTLLKNDDGVLPLDAKSVQRLVVLGMQSDLRFAHLGSSCEGTTDCEITAFEGLKAYLGPSVETRLFPLGAEGGADNRLAPIPNTVLNTFKPNGGEAFVVRAWEECRWPVGRKAWVDEPEIVGYVPYPKVATADAVRFRAKVTAVESGAHMFAFAPGAKVNGATILVDGSTVFNIKRGQYVTSGISLEKGRTYEVSIDVAGAACGHAFEFGWHTPSSLLGGKAERLRACREADAVIVFTGTQIGSGRAKESEGADMPSMKAPTGHDEEIAELLGLGLKRLVVVNRSSTPLELPWANQAHTLVLSPYLGQEGGHALARVLFGDVNPCGKTASTWPRRWEDTPVARRGTYTADKSIYNERFYVGYRWYEAEGIPVAFPFGFGLSYTTFDYAAQKLRVVETRLRNRLDGDRQWQVSIPIRNAGGVAGKEIAQLYVRPVAPRVERPVKELKGFHKTQLLQPGQDELATFVLTVRDLAYYDVFLHRWRADAGDYEVLVGASSSDIRATEKVSLPTDVIFND